MLVPEGIQFRIISDAFGVLKFEGCRRSQGMNQTYSHTKTPCPLFHLNLLRKSKYFMIKNQVYHFTQKILPQERVIDRRTQKGGGKNNSNNP